VPVAEVHLIVEQRKVVCAHVQDDRNHTAWMDTRRGNVDRQLPDGDLDTAYAPVADAEDALGVGRDDEVDVLWAHPEVAKRHLHGLDGVHGQVHPAGAANSWLNRSMAFPMVGV
jgi:hypothetical protein